MKRACLIILDSAGIGALPDAAEFGDAGAHTLGNIHDAVGGLKLPNLYAMGLGNIEDSRLPVADAPTAAYGRCAMKTYAKDTTCGHWEIAGIIMDQPFKTYPDGFPPGIIAEYERLIGRPTLANIPASGTEIIDRLGEEHMRTG
ncbi:MAG: phosphopentomutase, partial [Defluviitaleaceae bacterium]|nr:phosphopentomutase [Defluviitaleaceae bacterium]